MKKGRFLWSAHRITEKQKAGKARNIKEKQLKNSRSTASRLPVARLSSPRDNRPDKPIQKCSKSPEPCGFPGFFLSKKSARLCPILEGFDLACPGFSFEGDVLICQDLTKTNPVYLVLLSCSRYSSPPPRIT